MEWEIEFLHALQSMHSDVLDKIMLFVTNLGEIGAIWLITGFLLILIPGIGKETKDHVKMRRSMGICIILSIVLNFLLSNLVIKNMIQRPRPYVVDKTIIPKIIPSEYSYPSGHTSSSFAAAMAIYGHNKPAGRVALAFAALMAFTRMYFGVHYPTDILGGIVMGISCGAAVKATVSRMMKEKGLA